MNDVKLDIEEKIDTTLIESEQIFSNYITKLFVKPVDDCFQEIKNDYQYNFDILKESLEIKTNKIKRLIEEEFTDVSEEIEAQKSDFLSKNDSIIESLNSVRDDFDQTKKIIENTLETNVKFISQVQNNNLETFKSIHLKYHNEMSKQFLDLKSHLDSVSLKQANSIRNLETRQVDLLSLIENNIEMSHSELQLNIEKISDEINLKLEKQSELSSNLAFYVKCSFVALVILLLTVFLSLGYFFTQLNLT